MSRRIRHRYFRNKVLVTLFVLSVGLFAALFCYFGGAQNKAFANNDSKIIQTEDKTISKIEESNNRVNVCVEGGLDAFNWEAQEKNLQNICQYSVDNSLITLSTSKDYQKELSDSNKDQNNIFKIFDKDKDKVHDLDYIEQSKVYEPSEKCSILLFEVDNSDGFIDAIKNYDCVAWAEKDKSCQISDIDSPEDDLVDLESITVPLNKASKITENLKAPLQNKTEENDNQQKNIISNNQNRGVEALTNLNKQEKTYYKNVLSGQNNKTNQTDVFNNDPFYEHQWGFNSSNTKFDSDIDADKAWELQSQQGFGTKEKPVVAVLDTGLDINHPDIYDNVWKGGDIEELKPFGGSKYGVNVITSTPSETIQWKSDDITDDKGHGTHCASTIASVNNNNIGVCGVNGSFCEIMGVKWIQAKGGRLSDFVKGYNYIISAKKAGVNVACISNSWGSPYVEDIRMDCVLDALVTEAGNCGIVSIFAAGNSSKNSDLYPNLSNTNPYALSVGASADNGGRAIFSNYGKSGCDVFAPGAGILQAFSQYQNKGHSLSKNAYLPWIDGAQQPEDEIFYENFNNVSNGQVESKIKFSLLSEVGEEWDQCLFSDAECVIENGRAKINLDSSKVTEDGWICLRMQIDKTDEIRNKIAGIDLCNVSLRYGFDENIQKNSLADNQIYVFNMHKINSKLVLSIPPFLNSSATNLTENIANDLAVANVLFPEDESDKWSYMMFIAANEYGDNPCIYIDDFAVGLRGSGYGYLSGTSMSCPAVAGIASAISGIVKYSSESEKVIKILSCLKAGVSRNDLLENDCVTGGIVNYYNTIKAANCISDPDIPEDLKDTLEPVIYNSSYEYDPEFNTECIALDGYFFGKDAGTIKVNGTPAEILSWDNNTIKCKINQIDYTCKNITICRQDGFEFSQEVHLNEDDNHAQYCKGIYEQHDTSGIEYTAPDGTKYSTDDLWPVKSVSTEDNLYVLYYPTVLDQVTCQYNYILESYNYETQTWKNIPLDDLHVQAPNYRINTVLDKDTTISMAAGKDEVYLLYFKDPSYCELDQLYIKKLGYINNWGLFLTTYNEQQSAFVNENCVTDYASYGSSLVNYEGELLVGGSDFEDGIKLPPNNQEVSRIFPDTGTAHRCEFKLTQNIAGGHMSSANGKYWLLNARHSALSRELEGLSLAYHANNYYGPIRFDAQDILPNLQDHYSWPSNPEDCIEPPHMIWDEKCVDIGQNPTSISGCAVDQGVVYVGATKNNGKPNMSDTLLYCADADDDNYQWARVEDAAFSSYKLNSVTCCAHDNKLYVLGSKSYDNKTLFKTINLDDLGLSYTPDHKNAQTQSQWEAANEENINNENGINNEQLSGCTDADFRFVDIIAGEDNSDSFAGDNNQDPLAVENNSADNKANNSSFDTPICFADFPAINIEGNQENGAFGAFVKTLDNIPVVLIISLFLIVLSGAAIIFVKLKPKNYTHADKTQAIAINKKYIASIVLASIILCAVIIALSNTAWANANECSDYPNLLAKNNVKLEDSQEGNFISSTFKLTNDSSNSAEVTQYWIEGIELNKSELNNIDASLINLSIDCKYGNLWANGSADKDIQERNYAYAWKDDDCAIDVKIECPDRQLLDTVKGKNIYKLKVGFRSFNKVEQPSLDEYSWDQLRVVADDLSLNGNNSKFYEQFDNFAKNGDAKKFQNQRINPKYSANKEDDIYVRIVGINHDIVSGSDKKAGLTFIQYHSLPDLYSYDELRPNSILTGWFGPYIDWGSSLLSQELKDGGYIYATYPDELKSNIIRVDKKYTRRLDKENRDTAYDVDQRSEDFFILSASEIGYTNDNTDYTIFDEGEKYEYINNSKYCQKFPNWVNNNQPGKSILLNRPVGLYKYFLEQNDPKNLYETVSTAEDACQTLGKNFIELGWLRSLDPTTPTNAYILNVDGSIVSLNLADELFANYVHPYSVTPLFCL